jgi:hypothetical protein
MKKSKRVVGVLITLIIVVFILISVVIVAGTALPDSAPVSTPTVTPTPSPTPTPTPIPTPIPTPELTLEQKKLLLGINEKFKELKAGSIHVFFYKYNNEERISFNYCIDGSNPGEFTTYNIFNNEYMFSFCVPVGVQYFTSDYYKKHTESSKQLEGVEMLGSCSLVALARMFQVWEIKYDGNSLLDKFEADSYNMEDMMPFTNDLNMILSKDVILDVALDVIPQEYIQPFWEYVPNAVTPDAFLTPSPEIAPAVAP